MTGDSVLFLTLLPLTMLLLAGVIVYREMVDKIIGIYMLLLVTLKIFLIGSSGENRGDMVVFVIFVLFIIFFQLLLVLSMHYIQTRKKKAIR